MDNNGLYSQPGNDWYHWLMESTSAIPWEFDPETRCFTHLGPQAEKLFGYPLDDWYQPNFWENHLHPKDRDWALDICRHATQQTQDHEFEYRMLSADGRIVWVRDVITVQKAGSKTLLQGFMFDITERKQVENSMRALAINAPSAGTDAFFEECVKNLAAVYHARYAFIGLLKDDSFTEVQTLAVWAGDSIVDNFEYRLENTPCMDILECKKQLISSGASQLYAEDELLVTMGVDSYFGTPLITSKGKTLGLVAVMDTQPMVLNEWTAPILSMFASRIAVELEKRIANEELRQLNHSLEQRIKERTAELEAFSYSVSHDLRAPLRAIMGFSQALLDEYGKQMDPTALDYTRRIANGGQRMNQLIHDMLELSSLARRPIKPSRVDLSRLAHDCLQQLHEQDHSRDIQIHIEPGLSAEGDKELLRIALNNLLQNALKYTAKHQTPEIHFHRHKLDNGQSSFVVRDNGVGFDMRYANRLFQPFQRLHANEEFEGSGIGLATVARVLKRHGGDIWAHAEPGQGAAFYFTLP